MVVDNCLLLIKLLAIERTSCDIHHHISYKQLDSNPSQQRYGHFMVTSALGSTWNLRVQRDRGASWRSASTEADLVGKVQKYPRKGSKPENPRKIVEKQ